jgi:protein-disulfide isomerase
MKRGTWILLALAAACQVDDRDTKERLDKMQAQADALEKKLAGVKGAPAGVAQQPGQPAPGRPDPGTIYSVSIEGSPVNGPPTAKVTIVEVGEFA